MACKKTLNTIYTFLVIVLLFLIIYYFGFPSELMLKTVLMLSIVMTAGILILSEKKITNMYPNRANGAGLKSGGDIYLSIDKFSENLVTNEHYHSDDFKNDIDALKLLTISNDIGDTNEATKRDMSLRVIRVTAFLDKVRNCKTVIINKVKYNIDNEQLISIINKLPENERTEVEENIKDKKTFINKIISEIPYLLTDSKVSILNANDINAINEKGSKLVPYTILTPIKETLEYIVSTVLNTSPFADDIIIGLLTDANTELKNKLKSDMISADNFVKLNNTIINILNISFSDIDIAFYKEKLTTETLSTDNAIKTLSDKSLLMKIQSDINDIIKKNTSVLKEVIGDADGKIISEAIDTNTKIGIDNLLNVNYDDDDLDAIINGYKTASVYNKSIVDPFLKKINSSIIIKK